MLYINDDIYGFDLEEALEQLSIQRREQALRYKHELGQRTCAAAYLLLCNALRQEYGLTELPAFGYGEHGKPYIIGHEDIHFNLSHCNKAVVCVVSDKPVGVDVEHVRQAAPSLLEYTMNEEEIRLITSAPQPDVAFTRLWTMKEAVAKLSGHGLSNNLRDLLSNDAVVETVERLDKGYIYSVAR